MEMANEIPDNVGRKILKIPTPYGICKMLAMHALIMQRPSGSPEYINKRAREIATEITKEEGKGGK